MAYDKDIRENPSRGTPAADDPGGNPRAEQVLPGTPIFDAAGEKIGEAHEAGFTNGMLNARQYGVFARDLAIPLEVIARTDANGVYLTVTKDQLRDENGGS